MGPRYRGRIEVKGVKVDLMFPSNILLVSHCLALNYSLQLYVFLLPRYLMTKLYKMPYVLPCTSDITDVSRWWTCVCVFLCVCVDMHVYV